MWDCVCSKEDGIVNIYVIWVFPVFHPGVLFHHSNPLVRDTQLEHSAVNQEVDWESLAVKVDIYFSVFPCVSNWHHSCVVSFTNTSTLLEVWFTIYPLLAPKVADVTILVLVKLKNGAIILTVHVSLLKTVKVLTQSFLVLSSLLFTSVIRIRMIKQKSKTNV